MREIKTGEAKADERLFEVKLDDFVLQARMPKEMVLARAAGIFGDKYVPYNVLIKTAFDFLESVLTFESWQHLAGRLNDADDPFDGEEIGAVFEALMDQFTEARKEEQAAKQEPANRSARRAARTV